MGLRTGNEMDFCLATPSEEVLPLGQETVNMSSSREYVACRQLLVSLNKKTARKSLKKN